MGGSYSTAKPEQLREKAEKYEFQAHEARLQADAARRGEKYEKRKWLPKGEIDVRPGVSQRRVVSPRGVEVEAPVLSSGQEDALNRVQRPSSNYQVMELRSLENEPNAGQFRRAQPIGGGYGPAHPPPLQRQQHISQEEFDRTKKAKKADQYRTNLLHQREEIDRKINELDTRLTRDREAFKAAAERHKATTVEDARLMEEYLDKQRRRSELDRREKQIREMRTAYEKILAREKAEWDTHAQAQQDRELDAGRDRLKRIQEQERELHAEFEHLEPAVRKIKKSKEPDEQKLQKLSADIAKMEAERKSLDDKLKHARQEEIQKSRRLEALSVEEKTVRGEKERLAAETADKEKRGREVREHEWELRSRQLQPNVPDLKQIEAMKKELEADEKRVLEKKKRLEEALQNEEKELAARRDAIAQDVAEKQRLAKEKPVVSAEDYVEQYTTRKKALQTVQATTTESAPRSHSPPHPQQKYAKEVFQYSAPGQKFEEHTEKGQITSPSTAEKVKAGFQNIKEKIMPGQQQPGVPEAPPLSEKTKAEFARHEAHGGDLQTTGAFRETHFSHRDPGTGTNLV